MPDIRTESWSGHAIRFVEKNPGDWWAVLADVADALGLGQVSPIKRRLPKDVISNHTLPTAGGPQEMLIVNEYGIYETVFESRKPEAKAFKRWVFELLKQLRQQTGLEGFQIFRMLDKEHQRAAMAKLSQSLRQPARVDFIKANTIANKAVSTRYGHKKMLKKHEMTPEMLVHRQPILEDTVELMSVADRFRLPLKVSDAIYQKYAQ